MYGANKLNAFVIQFIGHLETAIRDAHIKKIISCMDVLQYILRIGYRKENVNNQERLDEVVNEKIEVITNVCTELINAIDRYYNTYLKYELSEKRYKQLYEENNHIKSVKNISVPDLSQVIVSPPTVSKPNKAKVTNKQYSKKELEELEKLGPNTTEEYITLIETSVKPIEVFLTDAEAKNVSKIENTNT